jgi:hypothetical protein
VHQQIDIEQLHYTNSLVLDMVTGMAQKIEALEITISHLMTTQNVTSNQVADLHRVKFTLIEKLVEKGDSSANLRTKILSRSPRKAIRK